MLRYLISGTIVFAFMLFAGTACKKSAKKAPVVDSPAVMSRTAALAGLRNWHGHYEYHWHDNLHPPIVDTAYNLSDTSFAISIVDTNTVALFGNNYSYEHADSANGVIYFGQAYYFYLYQAGAGVAYFFNRDSICYVNGDHSGIHSYVTSTVYHTY